MKRQIIYIIIPIIIATLNNCSKTESSIERSSLELINKYSINVEEPSGLDLALDNNSLWTVSDKYAKIYQLDVMGQILQEIDIPGNNFEGITVDFNGHSLWMVQESLSELLQVDILGNELQRIYVAGAISGSGGLEGITINTSINHLLLLKEKDPSVLIELNTIFEPVLFKHLYTASDYSGMDYNEIDNELWIVSDQDKKIYRCNIYGTVINSYSIDVVKAEGIAFDSDNNLIYIVSDSEESLYIFKLE